MIFVFFVAKTTINFNHRVYGNGHSERLRVPVSSGMSGVNYIMPSMPPWPPWLPQLQSFFSGMSVTMQSVVSNDAALHQVGVLARADVVAVRALVGLDLGDDERRLLARVGHELAQRGLDGARDDLGADLLVACELERVDRLLAAQVGDAAARDDALLDGRAGRPSWPPRSPRPP